MPTDHSRLNAFICEVGLRDGLQSVNRIMQALVAVGAVDKLAAACQPLLAGLPMGFVYADGRLPAASQKETVHGS